MNILNFTLHALFVWEESQYRFNNPILLLRGGWLIQPHPYEIYEKNLTLTCLHLFGVGFAMKSIRHNANEVTHKMLIWAITAFSRGRGPRTPLVLELRTVSMLSRLLSGVLHRVPAAQAQHLPPVLRHEDGHHAGREQIFKYVLKDNG